MPITAKLTVNTKFLDALKDFENDFTHIVKIAGEKVMEPIIPQLLDDLRVYPGPPNYPIQWKSEKQRRRVLSILRQKAIERGDFIIGPRGGIVITDLRYKRTFALRDGWTATIEVEGNIVLMKVGNPAAPAKFIVGTLNFRSLNEARLPQQPFHADRWQLASETLRFWFDIAQQDFTTTVDKLFGEFVRVEVTRRSRK